MDMIKVRIQLGSEAGGSTSPFVVAKTIYAESGVKGFYKGYEKVLLHFN